MSTRLADRLSAARRRRPTYPQGYAVEALGPALDAAPDNPPVAVPPPTEAKSA